VNIIRVGLVESSKSWRIQSNAFYTQDLSSKVYVVASIYANCVLGIFTGLVHRWLVCVWFRRPVVIRILALVYRTICIPSPSLLVEIVDWEFGEI